MKSNLIKFEEPTITPAKVEWNKQGIMDKVQVIVDEYKDMIFTEKTLKSGKATCADLNKLKKNINDEAKRIDKLLTEDVKIFRGEIKEVIALIDKAYNPIKTQMSAFEQARHDEKAKKILKMIDDLIKNQGLRKEYSGDLIIQKSYLAKGSTLKSIKEELTEIATIAGDRQDEYDKNIKLVNEMIDTNNKSFDIILLPEQYLKMLQVKNVPEIMMEITKDAQAVVQKKKKEFEAAAARVEQQQKEWREQEILDQAAEVEEVITNDEIYDQAAEVAEVRAEVVIEKYEVEGTDIQLDKLEEYMSIHDIKFEVID